MSKVKKKRDIWKQAICCLNVLSYFSVYLLSSALGEEISGVETEKILHTGASPEFCFFQIIFALWSKHKLLKILFLDTLVTLVSTPSVWAEYGQIFKLS